MGGSQSKKPKNEEASTSTNLEVNRDDPSPIYVKPSIESILVKTDSSNRGTSISSTQTNTNNSTSDTEANATNSPVFNTNVDIDVIIKQLLEVNKNGKIPKNIGIKNADIISICNMVREILLSQPMLVELAPPVKIVGDVHGQFTDLIRLFDLCGYPPSTNFLFLGDYVDRGKQSLETILLLFCYKIKYPENFFLLRGNHESASITRGIPLYINNCFIVYGFYDECKRRGSVKIWKHFVNVFNCLPVAALVASKIFCVHGGLSPSLNDMDDIRKIERPSDVPDYGLLNDLLWSDPGQRTIEWEDSERGVSYCFGKIVVERFLKKFEFDLVCRAHMVVEDGYEFFAGRKLVTIFSAPNYCGEFDNYAAIMYVNEDLLCSFELLKPLEYKFNTTNKRRSSSPPLVNHFAED